MQTQIAKPDANPNIVRSWYKYAIDCPQWNHLTYGHAPNFCQIARQAGQQINKEYGGLDIIKLHFPGIWLNCHKQKGNQWQTT